MVLVAAFFLDCSIAFAIMGVSSYDVVAATLFNLSIDDVLHRLSVSRLLDTRPADGGWLGLSDALLHDCVESLHDCVQSLQDPQANREIDPTNQALERVQRQTENRSELPANRGTNEPTTSGGGGGVIRKGGRQVGWGAGSQREGTIEGTGNRDH